MTGEFVIPEELVREGDPEQLRRNILVQLDAGARHFVVQRGDEIVSDVQLPESDEDPDAGAIRARFPEVFE